MSREGRAEDLGGVGGDFGWVGLYLYGGGLLRKRVYFPAFTRQLLGWGGVGGLIVFSLSKALLGAVTSLTGDAGRTLGGLKCPVRGVRRCGFVINGKVGGLFRHTLPRKRGARRGMLHMHRRFMPRCSGRGTSRDGPCPKVPALLRTLRAGKVRLTITSGGCRTTAGGLITRCFPGVQFVTMLKRQSKIGMGPSPTVMRSVLQVTGIRGGRILCIKSSNMSVRATVGTKIASYKIA